MSKPAETRREITRRIGELCFGGDWACAHGDVSGLRDIASRLSDYAPEPLHCQLQELSDVCRYDPERATALWTALKDQVYQTCEP
jgi:hypothetical protein